MSLLTTIALVFRLLRKRPQASLLLCIGSPASVGGTEFLINKIAEQLTKSGERVLVVTTGKIAYPHLFLQRLQKENIPHFSLGKSAPLVFFFRRFGATRSYFFNPPAAKLIPAAKKAGLKTIYVETGMPQKNDPWWHPVSPQIPYLDKVVAVSEASLTHFETVFSYRGPTSIFYPLIDPPPLGLPEPSSSAVLHVVYFGKIYRNKGVKVLLQAFRNVLEEFPTAHLTFIGEGPDKAFLQKQVTDSAMQENVHFLGVQPKERLWELLSTFDLFCLPSLSEGAPCAILEAMAIRLPVIATRIGGIPEMIEHNVSGILVEPNDPQALGEALSLCAREPSFRKKLGIESEKRYRDRFSAGIFE